ncbi:hypothetical protein [Streptomyces sp. ADI98-10]|uniref:hypothetical protein n=1 Tax=Streptomyces sp. ADI98-10 TaxID=1522763 RepID=UPI000F558C43|nr:hypothetical protein [Streptomyces sp. ADI98-10]RPK78200.1 hypothetical protein EES46_34445 [Streptomyces sp. ADI98-10]
MLTVFSQFPQRISDVTTQLIAQGLPLTAPATPAPPLDPDDPWASSRPAPPVNRTTLAWCTAAQMLSAHHRTPLSTQVHSADALIRELGVRGLAQLHTDLHGGAPIDYRFTRCPYCSGCGEDPLLPDCVDLGCPPQYEFIDHDHICQVCQGESFQPDWFAEERIVRLDAALAEAISTRGSAGCLPGG